MDIQNQNLQDPNSILQALNTITQQYSNNIPIPQLPSLNFQAPSGVDMNAKYKEFLDKAAQDPNIISYYNNLLQKAQGDANIAIGFLEEDYKTGVRQENDNLKATLQSLGLTFGQESKTEADTLNKRGIAMTQDPNNPGMTQYAGGGQAGTELGTLNTSQKLRQEAEARSSGQKVENMGLSRREAITSQGQKLYDTATNLASQKKTDVLNAAGTNYNIYQNQVQADETKKVNEQNLNASGGAPTSGPKDYNTRMADYTAAGGKGDLPVGFEA